MSAAGALVAGLRAVARRPALPALLLAVNLFSASLLALPLAGVLEEGLKNTDSAGQMLYGFDYAWWTAWHTNRAGWTKAFQPDLFGAGFAFKDLDLLLRGSLPGGLFESAPDAASDYRLDALILGLGIAYMLLQAFLTGGVLGVLRGRQDGFALRGFAYGSGFYFGRLLRVTLLVLALDGLVFWLNTPLAAWMERLARESVSETTALFWLFGRHLLLLLALLLVQMLSGYAKVIVVLEDRASALLALVSATGFCLRRLGRAFGHLLLVALLGLVLVAAWSALDAAFETTGYKTQLVSLALSQALVFGLIALRLSLSAGQIALYREPR